MKVIDMVHIFSLMRFALVKRAIAFSICSSLFWIMKIWYLIDVPLSVLLGYWIIWDSVMRYIAFYWDGAAIGYYWTRFPLIDN